MKARVEWDGYRWVAIPEVGGTTQAKRLDQLPERIAEVVELMTGKPIDPATVELDIDFPGAAEAAAVNASRAHLADVERDIAEKTLAAAHTLHANGVTLRDAATMLGLTHQRVHQLLHQPA